MAKTLRKPAPGSSCVPVLLMVGLAIVRGTAAAAGQQRWISTGEPTITVRIDNVAAISADNLRLAEDRAADVFRQIGVQVIWIDGDVHPDIITMFTLALVVEPKDGTEPPRQEALGFALPLAHRAWVFWDRIDAFKYHTSPALALGDVMAHELGHLLLPSTPHSPAGIMSPTINKQFRGTETFTRPQARAILIQLQKLRKADN